MDKYQKQLAANMARVKRLRENPLGFYVSAALAGFYIGLGFLLSQYAKSALAGHPMGALVAALLFPVGLVMVIFAGSDLFTGIVLSISLDRFQKQNSRLAGLKLGLAAWLGNFIGSFILAVLLYFSRTGGTALDETILNSVSAKASLTIPEMIFRGILCNIFVCLAIWIAYALQSEGAKIAICYALISAFVFLGFEHVVANMFIFSYALLKSGAQVALIGQTIPLISLLKSLLFVTIGNIIGGALFVATPYHLIMRREIKDF